MSLLKLSDGTKITIEQPNEREGLLRGRSRPILEVSKIARKAELDKLEAKLMDPKLTEEMQIFYNDNDNEDTPDDQLQEVSHKDFAAFTIPGDFTKAEIVTKEATPDTPAEYGWKLTAQLGQRLYGD